LEQTTLPLAVVGTVPSQVATIFHLPHLNRCKFDSLLTTTLQSHPVTDNFPTRLVAYFATTFRRW